MVKEGFRGISIKEEYFDMAKVLSEAKSLGLGRSVASIVERGITFLISEIESKYQLLEERSFYEALKEYRYNKKENREVPD